MWRGVAQRSAGESEADHLRLEQEEHGPDPQESEAGDRDSHDRAAAERHP